ncbi:hypothetical protein [Delftia acidovorans]|uniref:hypothetical protein n=1 Tax=Delftia acidovorans TaxID=80866 RepID=UPI00242E1609|nr:hypothetical protein [Delftia acidovorans]
MTDPVIPEIPAAPVVPPYPALGAPNFNQMAYDVGTSMPGVVSGLNAIAAAARECALAAQFYSQKVSDSVSEASTARDEAVEAQGLAEDARDAAVTAKGQSEAARDASVTAKGQSEAARDASQTARGGSEAARDASVTAKGQSEAARDAAQAYRNQAEVFATKQLVASSTTSVAPGAGAKSFTIEASRSFVVGMYLVATSASDPNTRMSGYVQSYSGTTGALTLTVDAFSGSTAKADWAIGVAARSTDGSLVQQVITANTTAVPGVVYVISGANVTLALPTTTAGLSNDSRIGIRLAAAVSGNQQIDFGSIPFRGQTPGLCYIDKPGFGLDLQFNVSTGSWV